MNIDDCEPNPCLNGGTCEVRREREGGREGGRERRGGEG